jgi:hypothetical protein
MIIGLLVYNGQNPKKNIFNVLTRDNLSVHWIAMRKYFLNYGIKIVTEDELNASNHDFEIHIDIQEKKSNVPAFLLLWESKFINSMNLNKKKLNKYHRLFSWDTQTAEFKSAINFFFPFLCEPEVLTDGYSKRAQLVVMIANNKSFSNFNSPYNLYAERVRTIRWFERHFLNDFALYGGNWNKSARIPSKLGGFIHLIENLLPFSPFRSKSWRGAIKTKDDVLKNSRFSIVYENIGGQNNYITEKIFDAFRFGNVPVYLGAENIFDYIPKNCFIDRRQFKSHFDLYCFLKYMKEDEYLKYQHNAKIFLSSKPAKIFSVDNFIKIVASQIILDLQNITNKNI